MDSPADESPSLLGQDENSSSPKPTGPSTSMSSAVQHAHTSSMNNGQVSRRTLEKRRKAFKSAIYSSTIPSSHSRNSTPSQSSLRYESLLKRKRTLELLSQRLTYDKERLLIERKNLDIQLAVNECEHERCTIDRRRIELALQKCQSEQFNHHQNNNHHHQQAQQQSDHEDLLEDNPSYDEMSDINE